MPLTLIDTGGVDLAAEDSLSRSVQHQAREAIADADVILHVVDARAGLGPGDAEVAALLRAAPQPVIVVANKVDDPAELAPRGRAQQARPRGAAVGLRQPWPRHRRPARPDHRARAGWRRGRRRRAAEDRDPRPPQRRQVIAAERAARLRADDRQRDRRHHPRLDRHAGRARRPTGAAGRHRRDPPPGQAAGLDRLLRAAARRARRRARRRRDPRLRCVRGSHLRGPADRRAGDEGRLRDDGDLEQVGHRRGRSRRREGEARAAPAAAAAGDHPLRPARPQRAQGPAQGARARGPARRADAAPRSSIGSSPRRSSACRRRRSGDAGCASTTPPRSARLRRGSRSRSTIGR